MVQAIRILAPTSRVTHIHMARLRKDYRRFESFVRALRRYDLVFAQPMPAGFFPNAGSDALKAALPSLTTYPVVLFSAFHPDTVYVGDLRSVATAKLTPSPMGTYHSALVLFGHRRGLPPGRIARLFRREMFERVGYLDSWDHAARELVAYAAAADFDLTRELARWSQRGCFMHNINHPKLFVLGDIARRLLRSAGLEPHDIAVEDYIADGLVDDVIWPVYPPIAEFYGVDGSYLFKPRQADPRMPGFLDLERFVSESVALYRGMPAAMLACDRVDRWTDSPEICAAIDALGRN